MLGSRGIGIDIDRDQSRPTKHRASPTNPNDWCDEQRAGLHSRVDCTHTTFAVETMNNVDGLKKSRPTTQSATDPAGAKTFIS